MRPVQLLFLLASSHLLRVQAQRAAGTTASGDPCPCIFTVAPEEEVGCAVYGQMGDDVLIPWSRANQTCLDVFNIKDRAIDTDVLLDMCPFPNETDVNVNAVFNFLRFGSSPSINAFKSIYPDFWNASDPNYRINDPLITPRTTLACQGSQSLCWSELKTFFDDGREDLLEPFCSDNHARHANSLEKEQSFARIRLCSDGIEAVCGELGTEVADRLPVSACSAFGLGPAENAIPTCDGRTFENTGSDAVPRLVHLYYGIIMATASLVIGLLL